MNNPLKRVPKVKPSIGYTIKELKHSKIKVKGKKLDEIKMRDKGKTKSGKKGGKKKGKSLLEKRKAKKTKVSQKSDLKPEPLKKGKKS